MFEKRKNAFAAYDLGLRNFHIAEQSIADLLETGIGVAGIYYY